MKKQYLRVLCALMVLAGFGVAAHGQTIDRIDLKIPYEFVAAGKTLPAGNYSVRRVRESSGELLVLSSFEKRTSVLVLSNQFESVSVDKVYVNFEQVGDQHFLTKIQTGDHLFTIPVSRKTIAAAAMKSSNGTSAPASMGGNN